MSFRAPGGYSPSTPDRKKRSIFTQPSTTPKGLPPSHLSDPSTTPAGPPPTSLFGSSRNPTTRLTFGPKSSVSRGFRAPDSSPPASEDEEEDEDMDAPGEEVTEELGIIVDEPVSPGKSAFMSSITSSPRGMKRSRNGQIRSQCSAEMATLARGFARQSRPKEVQEPDEVVLRQDEILSHVDSEMQKNPLSADDLLTNGAAQLCKLWVQSSVLRTKEGSIGPVATNASVRAEFIASLMLQLRHPSQFDRRPQPVPVARALLDWLDVHHNPFPDEYDTIHLHEPSPADHERFWDGVYASLSRGRLDRVVSLLRDAGWENAYTAADDFPQDQPQGYVGQQLENVHEVVSHCLQVLSSCPALTDNDWDMKDEAWTLFRHRVRQAAKRLEQYAGDEEDLDDSNVFGRSQFSLSAASRRAESKVPWSIFENVKLVYGLLLGDINNLLDTSQDWLEASIFLTVWWDGDEDSGPKGQKPREVDVLPLVAYRKRLAEAFSIVTDGENEAVFHVNTLDSVQVALACVLADSTEGAIGVLRSWTAGITSAVVEIASLAGWLPQGRPRSAGLLQQGFTNEDLMVLSHGPGQQLQQQQSGQVDRDEVLIDYADVLKQRDVFSDKKNEREGWELAVSVLGRLDDLEGARHRIDVLLDGIELSSEERVNRVLDACNDLELTMQARAISERYADTLATSMESCGGALMFYARAHATTKLKDMLKNLTAMCLLHSSAVPSSTNMDAQLSSLLSNDRPALLQLTRVDPDAAALLASHLSGYATLRRFYELRDGQQEATLGPLQRQREAANALMAVTESAADCIRGGLFDRTIESVVSVDGVLALLGEALPLLGNAKRIFTKDQVFALLRITEDFASAPFRIRDHGEELLQASVEAYRLAHDVGGELKKSRSEGSSSRMGSSYDMLASSVMFQSQESEKSVEAQPRAWDWRRGLDGLKSGVGLKEVLGLLRLALAQEVGRGWSGALRW